MQPMTSAAEDSDDLLSSQGPGRLPVYQVEVDAGGTPTPCWRRLFGHQGPSPVSLEPSQSRRGTSPRGQGGSRPARIPPPDTGDISREDREAAHRANRDGFQVALVLCRLHEFLRTALVPVGAAPGAYRIVGISWGPAEGRIKNL